MAHGDNTGPVEFTIVEQTAHTPIEGIARVAAVDDSPTTPIPVTRPRRRMLRLVTKLVVVLLAAAAAVIAFSASDAQPESDSGSLDLNACLPAVVGTVQLGSTGPDALCVEAALVALGYPATSDGTFEQVDVDAVVAFQQRVGRTADGLVGPNTLASLIAAFR